MLHGDVFLIVATFLDCSDILPTLLGHGYSKGDVSTLPLLGGHVPLKNEMLPRSFFTKVYLLEKKIKESKIKNKMNVNLIHGQDEEGPDEAQIGLVGVQLTISQNANYFESYSNIPMVCPYSFTKQMDAKTSGIFPSTMMLICHFRCSQIYFFLFSKYNEKYNGNRCLYIHVMMYSIGELLCIIFQ